MVELEILNEYRFYKLQAQFPQKCYKTVENIYSKVDNILSVQKICLGLLRLHMVDNSINMICPHVGCNTQYDIIRVCNVCGLETTFEDVTCDTCEPRVINIATWQVSIQEALKTIKKVNRAFKKDLIDEKEWKSVLQINTDEIKICEENLEKEEILPQSTN